MFASHNVIFILIIDYWLVEIYIMYIDTVITYILTIYLNLII